MFGGWIGLSMSVLLLNSHLNLTASAVQSLNKRMAILENENKYIDEVINETISLSKNSK